MSNTSSPEIVPAEIQRRVLLWRPDSDESHVQANVEGTAKFLKVEADAVVEAIDRGDLLAGWFVDWDASPGT